MLAVGYGSRSRYRNYQRGLLVNGTSYDMMMVADGRRRSRSRRRRGNQGADDSTGNHCKHCLPQPSSNRRHACQRISALRPAFRWAVSEQLARELTHGTLARMAAVAPCVPAELTHGTLPTRCFRAAIRAEPAAVAVTAVSVTAASVASGHGSCPAMKRRSRQDRPDAEG